MSIDKFVFDGKPVAKPRMTRRDKWLNPPRPAVAQYRAFKTELNLKAKQQKFELSEAHRVTFLVEMPKSWSKKKKLEMYGEPHRQRPDLDNYLKALWDCLLPEDSACHYVVAIKKWSDKPGIVVENFPKDLDF